MSQKHEDDVPEGEVAAPAQREGAGAEQRPEQKPAPLTTEAIVIKSSD